MVRRARRWFRHTRWRVAPYRASVAGLIRRRRVVHMLHIGKTGGTAVKVALRRCRKDPSVKTHILLHRHRVRLADIPPWDDVFFFVRDPTSRYVSAFNSRQREGRPAHYHPWRPEERRIFERFPTADALARSLVSPDAETRRAARRAMMRIPHVSRGLTRWLADKDLLERRRSRIILVGRQESLATDFQRLRQLLDLPATCTLPAADSIAHRSTGLQPTDLSAEAQAGLRAWFREDFELLDLLETWAR